MKKGKIDWDEKRVQWISRLSNFCEQVKVWCNEIKWEFTESQRNITEEFLGTYSVPCLIISTPSGRLHIEPVGLNIIGAQGRIDILSYPSLNKMIIVGVKDEWKIYTETRVAWPHGWSKDTFIELSTSLSE